MVIEYREDEQPRTPLEIEQKEHAFISKAKRVVSGGTAFAVVSGETVSPATITIGAASATTTIKPSTTYEIVATEDCFIAMKTGSAPTASTSDIWLPKRTPYRVYSARFDNIAAIQDSTGGKLYITEIL